MMDCPSHNAIDLRLLVDRIPHDVLHEHILPLCSIDIRLALGVPPRRLWHGTTRHEFELRVTAHLMVVHQRRQACYKDHAERDWITVHIPILCSPIFKQEDGRIQWMEELVILYDFVQHRAPTACAMWHTQMRNDSWHCLAYWERMYIDGGLTHAPDMHCSKHPEDFTELWLHFRDPTYVAPRRTCTCT
jgi:hypothetical protein